MAVKLSCEGLAKTARDLYISVGIRFSRCALLNAPAGSFSKDIDEVETTA
jgi:hypothetical protein